MLRFTKIIATIGPATCDEFKMKALIEAGADCFRFNIKHNTAAWHQNAINTAQRIAATLNRKLAIIADVPNFELATSVTDYDYVALSYITSAQDIQHFKDTYNGSPIPKIIAKIENKTALINLEPIIDIADAVMIARGDLATDIPFEHLAFWQKRIIASCRLKFTPVIVATQMLESMMNHSTPTRAEATDVANAVFDGTDALMLSGETAMGKYPSESVKIMNSIATFCDQQPEVKTLNLPAATPSELLVKSAAAIINQSNQTIKAAIVFSQSGSTVRRLSAYRMLIPIIAVTNNEQLLETLNLSRGVIPHFSDLPAGKFEIEGQIFEDLLSHSFLKKGDTVLVIHGSNWFTSGSTSDLSLKVL